MDYVICTLRPRNTSIVTDEITAELTLQRAYVEVNPSALAKITKNVTATNFRVAINSKSNFQTRSTPLYQTTTIKYCSLSHADLGEAERAKARSPQNSGASQIHACA